MMIADDKPDIMMITEVIPKGQVNPITRVLLDIDEYECILNFDPNTMNLGASGMRGVAIYHKKNLSVTQVDLPTDEYKDHLWIEIGTNRKNTLLCGCIYRTQSKDVNKEGCMESTKLINDIILNAYKRNNNLLITGDFNFKEIDWPNESVPSEKAHLLHFIRVLQDCFLYQHVTEPTRYREGENASLLDLILSSEEGVVHDLSYHPPLAESDHICLKFDVYLGTSQPAKKSGSSYIIFKANFVKICEGLNHQNWIELLTKSFTEDYDTFCRILAKVTDENKPPAKDPTKKRSIYMNHDALRLKNTKNKLWRKYLTKQSKYDHDKYVNCKNQLRNLTRKLRTDFEKHITAELEKKPKVFWKYANSRLKTRASIPTLTRKDGTKAKSAKEQAETLNMYFASSFTKENTDDFPSPPIYNICKFLSNINITPEMVLKKLKNLDQNKSAGHDEWHPFFLKSLSEALSLPLSILFNKSLKEGAHSSWKIAIITPIYKKGNKSDPGNYRPVSLTSVISKTMESILRDVILNLLVENNVLSDGQHGFVPGRDCMTQLLLCLEDWTSIFDAGHAFDVIYTDFAKAFDSVAHERLILKLEAVEITGDVLNWIRSFLVGRSQSVRVEGETSGWQKMLSGIPQGSVLGPLLFVIFINDMPDVVKDNICKLFADDCELYGIINSDIDQRLQKDLSNLENWSNVWDLPFNATKCKVMHFGRGNPHLVYTMNGCTLEVTTQERDLGVIIDNELKFHVHTAAAVKKANQVLCIIKRSYCTRNADCLNNINADINAPRLMQN